jgi:hypothetical protein
VNAITGRLCQDPARSEPCRKAIREKFVFAPPEEKPSDYSADGRVWVGPEYQAWLATSENRLAAVLAARQNGDSLKITFPPPGTIVELDPDLPGNGGTLRLQAHGAEVINWRSPSLPIVSRGHKDVALLSAGTHRLIATDVRRGLQAETWIEVRSR